MKLYNMSPVNFYQQFQHGLTLTTSVECLNQPSLSGAEICMIFVHLELLNCDSYSPPSDHLTDVSQIDQYIQQYTNKGVA